MEHKWDPNHSKWKAALEKGMSVKLNGDENILYLGASSGTTVSFLSGLTTGTIFAVEKAPLMAIHLVKLAEERKNIFPVFIDARDIEKTKEIIKDTKINILFQDIPSKDQIQILKSNAKLIDKDCKLFLSLKTQSISQKSKEETLENVKKELEEDFNILEVSELEPFHQKHYFLILSKK